MKRILVGLLAVLSSTSVFAQFTNPSWVAFYPPSGDLGPDEGVAVAKDDRGNTLVTGWSTQTTGGINIVTAKYSPLGALDWAQPYNNTTVNGIDKPAAIFVDSVGNVYVVGESQRSTSPSRYDMVTLKYSATGAPQWAVRESSLSTHNYYGKDIAVDPQGDVFVCGYREHPGQGDSQEYVTIRYTSTGALAGAGWPAIYNRTQGQDRAVALALGPGTSKDVYVTGVSSENADGDWATVKYAGSGGDPVWVALTGGDSMPDFKSDEPRDIAVDASSSVFVTGYLARGGNQYNVATMSYNGTTGADRWVEPIEYSSPGLADSGEALALEKNYLGNATHVYVTGYIELSTTNSDYATFRIPANNATTHDWIRTYNNPAFNGLDKAASISVVGNANVYVTGTSESNFLTGDIVTLKYHRDGTPDGSAIYTANGDCAGRSIAVSCAGTTHVAGFGTPTNKDMLTLVYPQSVATSVPSNYTLLEGIVTGGNLASLQSSNDGYMTGQLDPQANRVDYPFKIEVTGTSALGEFVSELCLSVESKATGTAIDQRIELFDYDSSAWIAVSEIPMTLTDSVAHGQAPYDARRFVGPAGQVKARIGYRQVGPVFQVPWTVSIDHVRWEVLD